jgi:hypothetical protein
MKRHAFSAGALTLIAAMAFSRGAAAQNFCFQTAEFLEDACRRQAEAEFFVSRAICTNLTDSRERSACLRQGRTTRSRSRRLCREQNALRRDICDLVGQDRFDPVLDPGQFETDFTSLQSRNAFFPLDIGNRSRFEGEDELRTVEVLDETRLIDGLTCVGVNARTFRNGDLVEETINAFAQARDRTVVHCGEELRSFESFEGDDPRRPELVGVEGSFRAGRNGDRPGITFRGAPIEGDTFFESFSLGNAEDVVEILSTDFGINDDDNLDRFVPRRLGELLCAADCVVTRSFSLLEPGEETFRFFAEGIGLFLEVDPETRETLQLTECNFDPRCDDLPRP